jgi:hypothetical protein
MRKFKSFQLNTLDLFTASSNFVHDLINETSQKSPCSMRWRQHYVDARSLLCSETDVRPVPQTS